MLLSLGGRCVLADLGEGEFDPELQDARQRLSSLRAGPPSRTDLPAGAEREGPARGAGEASDGRVQAVAARGRLVRLELDPRLMRLSEAELGEQIAVAVNAALEDLRAQVGTADSEPVPDPAALADTLREVQEEGLRQMTLITRAIGDATARIQSRPR
jgi:hypothetical protein